MKFPAWPDPLGYRNIDLGLDRVYKLLARIGNPHKLLPPVIHVAGTNGKGSTLAYLEAIFSAAGLKVHKYISPHLVRFNERIILAGKEIEDQLLNEFLEQCRRAAETHPQIPVTFFEGITVGAFLAFSKIKADILLLETGMGGRLDATNVIENPLATIITAISKDHMEFLGKSLDKIAFEKAGIIKRKTPVIIARQKKPALKVIIRQAAAMKAPIYAYGKNWQVQKSNNSLLFKLKNKSLTLPLPSLIGAHQIQNAGNAVATILIQKKFPITKDAIAKGLENTRWRARLEKIEAGKFFKMLPENFQLFLDGGHNEDGAKTIADFLKKSNRITPTKNYLICGMLDNKDSHAFLKHLVGYADLLVGITIDNEPKSKSAHQIAGLARQLAIKSFAANNFIQAIKKIISHHHSQKPAKIIICGSLYLAGEFLSQNESCNVNSG